MADESKKKPRPAASPSGGVTARDAQGSPPAVAALRMETLTLWVIQRSDDFPKKLRFTVADRWIDTCIEVQTDLVEASFLRDRRPLLLRASRGLVRARVLARMAAQLRALSLAQEAHFGQESVEIGKMIGGWLKRTTPAPSGTSVEREGQA